MLFSIFWHPEISEWPSYCTKRFKEVFNCEAMALKQGVHVVIRGAAGDAWMSFVDAPEAVNNSLSLFVSHAKFDDWATPGSF